MILLQFSNILKATHFHTDYTYEATEKPQLFLPVFVVIYTQQITSRSLFWRSHTSNALWLEDRNFFPYRYVMPWQSPAMFCLLTTLQIMETRRWEGHENICKAIKRTRWEHPWVLHSRTQQITPALVCFALLWLFFFLKEMLENTS